MRVCPNCNALYKANQEICHECDFNIGSNRARKIAQVEAHARKMAKLMREVGFTADELIGAMRALNEAMPSIKDLTHTANK